MYVIYYFPIFVDVDSGEEHLDNGSDYSSDDDFETCQIQDIPKRQHPEFSKESLKS